MHAVGLGNQFGADIYHKDGLESPPSCFIEAATMILENTNIIAGLGLVENAFERTSKVTMMKAQRSLFKSPFY